MESDRFQLFLLIGAKLGRFSTAARLTLLSGSKKNMVGDQRNPRTDQIPQGHSEPGTYASTFLCINASCARRRTYTARI
jgi:hypothetical protein